MPGAFWAALTPLLQGTAVMAVLTGHSGPLPRPTKAAVLHLRRTRAVQPCPAGSLPHPGGYHAGALALQQEEVLAWVLLRCNPAGVPREKTQEGPTHTRLLTTTAE